MSSLTQSPAWKALLDHQQQMKSVNLTSLCTNRQARMADFSLSIDDGVIDYSRNLVTSQTIELLTALARQQNVEKWRADMLSGQEINNTEKQAVLHTALRLPEKKSLTVKGQDIFPFIREQKERMYDFVDSLHAGRITGYDGQKIKTIVSIGIGGSELGPRLVVDALQDYALSDLSIYFMTTIDPVHVDRLLKKCDPATTLFLIASKSFVSQETLCNADIARRWFATQTHNQDSSRHFVALTANRSAALEYGIDPSYIFDFWGWVGGRFSLWSSIGLSIILAVGKENFEQFLKGAQAMDTHFETAPLAKNAPVLLALLAVWYRNFWQAEAEAVLPYSHHLRLLPDWLQQLSMESNGKSVDRDGQQVDYKTAPVLFGMEGPNGQHSFHQLLHQGTSFIPADFIGIRQMAGSTKESMLLAHMQAQADALMTGTKEGDSHHHCPGNRPSNMIFLPRLDPYYLGWLLALYEHKIFVQGVLWNINSFDQWGVELGKKLAKKLLKSF